MRFRVRYSDTFESSFSKAVPSGIRPQVRMFIEARLSRSPRDGSVLWPPSPDKELRTDSIYAGGATKHIRILFEIAGDEVVLWSASKGRLPEV